MTLPVSALAATGTIDSTGTGDAILPVSALASTGSVTGFASGGVVFEFALVGTSELADTALGFKHYEHTSDIDRVLQL